MFKQRFTITLASVLITAVAIFAAVPSELRAEELDGDATYSTESVEEPDLENEISDETEVSDEDNEPEITEPEVTAEPAFEPEISEEPEITVTEAPAPTDIPEVTATPEPTAEPTATPVPLSSLKGEDEPAAVVRGISVHDAEEAFLTDLPQPTTAPSNNPVANPTAVPVTKATPTPLPFAENPKDPTPIPTATPFPIVTTKPSSTPVPTSTIKPTPVVSVTSVPTLTPSLTPSVSAAPTAIPVNSKPIYDFVERLYTKCLERPSDPTGQAFWAEKIINGEMTGIDVGLLFVFSDEYKDSGKTSEQFVEMLYLTFFDRPSEADGKAYWVNMLDNTPHTRKYVFACFADSQEYKDVCDAYGIERGRYSSDDPCDLYPDIADFATRLYTDVLQRPADPDGISYWAEAMGTFVKTPIEAANDFFESEEFKAKNLNDNDYIETLYKTCMDRASDEQGKNEWLTKLSDSSATRKDIRDFFLSCEEFKGIMSKSGVVEHPMVTVAKTQLGQEGGAPYWGWYGYSYRIEWCACFVSWCADQCGYISAGIVPKYKWCLDAKAWFEARNQWVTDPQYRPKSGDIIFFDWNGNGVIDHTGIVVGTDATGRIHTIEGNKNDVCSNDRILYVGDPDICGYGVPAY